LADLGCELHKNAFGDRFLSQIPELLLGKGGKRKELGIGREEEEDVKR